MPGKAFRTLDDELGATPLFPDLFGPPSSSQKPLSRKAFRCIDSDFNDDSKLAALFASALVLLCVLADIIILRGLATQVRTFDAAHLPASLLVEAAYLIAATVVASFIDLQALLSMFLETEWKILNWAAATGVICSVLKLSMASKARNYNSVLSMLSGELQPHSLFSAQGQLESWYGSSCCIYLATYFAMLVIYNGQFQLGKVAKKIVVYGVSGIALGMFRGVFAKQSMGWLIVMHALAVAWAVAQCKRHVAGSFK
mmetsp:Transcript_41309/g.95646  ORF Transcript_41309/g.95646 Transcript_41309/m.95646 type:complete len:256 (-) Transcript_41309:151-918(-)